MKTLQVSMENRVGCTLRGIVTLPETNEPVPFVLNLHGFASICTRIWHACWQTTEWAAHGSTSMAAERVTANFRT